MQAALLLRVSTEVQDLESQIKDLRPVAESMGYEVPEEYIPCLPVGLIFDF